MIDLIVDGECCNGRHAERRSPWHWRCEARGDDGHYCYYFHFGLRAAAEGEATIDIEPDRTLLPDSARSFRHHRPEHVWLQRDGRWQRHPVDPDGCDGEGLRLRIAMTAGEQVRVSRMYPFPYSAVTQQLAELAIHSEARIESLGQSTEGREIPSLVVGAGATSLLALAGQHPAEFGGVHAVMGIAEWLLTEIPEARAVREAYTVTLVPVLNPDGNVTGRCGRNARGVDLYRAFAGAATGPLPAAPEAARLWEWTEAARPALSLHFHCFTQPSPGGSFPWEGLYTPPDDAFPNAATSARQRLLDDYLAWGTDGLSQQGSFSHHVPGAFEYQLATRGVPTVFYEVQDTVGPYRQRRTGVQVLRAALAVVGSRECHLR